MKKPYWLFLYMCCACDPANVFASACFPVYINTGKADFSNTGQQPDTNRWIDDFREFRTAVYQQNKNKIKSFIDFPIINDNNEIWWLVYDGKGRGAQLLSDKIKPFTEKDFDLHYS